MPGVIDTRYCRRRYAEAGYRPICHSVRGGHQRHGTWGQWMSPPSHPESGETAFPADGARLGPLSFLKTLSAARSLVAMIARVTMRTELGASRALPTARHARVELGIRFKPVVSRCLVAMIARVTMRPELGPSRALLTALHPL